MSTAPTSPPGGSAVPGAPRRSDRSPWNWLLLVPIVVPLIVPLYNHEEPTLFGWPLFYWLQMLFVGLGVLTTVVVYRATRSNRTDPAATRDAASRDAATGDAVARDRER